MRQPAQASSTRRPLVALLIAARRALGVGSQGDLGVLLGSSRRSGQRWEREEAYPTNEQVYKLAALVHPHDPSLAAELAAARNATLEQLGIVRPPPPPPPPIVDAAPAPSVRAMPDPVYLADTVVCAAAEAARVMPDEIRPALRAAVRRARLAQLTIEDLDRALNASEPGSALEGGSADSTGKRDR